MQSAARRMCLYLTELRREDIPPKVFFSYPCLLFTASPKDILIPVSTAHSISPQIYYYTHVHCSLHHPPKIFLYPLLTALVLQLCSSHTPVHCSLWHPPKIFCYLCPVFIFTSQKIFLLLRVEGQFETMPVAQSLWLIWEKIDANTQFWEMDAGIKASYIWMKMRK